MSPFRLSVARFFAVVLSGTLIQTALWAAPQQPKLDEKHRAFFKEYCVGCHNAEKQKGKLRLDNIAFDVDTIPRADIWQKVLNSLNSGEMPPEEEKQPPRALKADFLDELARTLVMARSRLSDTGGTIAMRRLNRREYKNTLRDLLGVEVDVRDLPSDSGAGTFDTVGSSLFMSSDQFEQYLALGRKALDEHFARSSAVQETLKVHLETEEAALKEIQGTVNGFEKSIERYHNWVKAVDTAAALPENETLVKELRDKPDVKANPHRFYVNWSKRMPDPKPKDFGLTDGDEAEFQRGQYRKSQYAKDYLNLPHKDTGSYLLVSVYHAMDRISAGKNWPPGSYKLRVRIGVTPDAPPERRFLQVGQAAGNNFTVLSTHQITGTIEKPNVLEIPVTLKSDGDRTFCLREKTDTKPDAAYSMWMDTLAQTGSGPKPALWIDWAELEGPTDRQPSQTAASPGGTFKLRKDPEEWANKYMPIYAEGYEKKYARFKEWCAAIDAASGMPENETVVNELRKDPRLKNSPHIFYNNWKKISGAPAPTEFGFRDQDDAQFARSEYAYHFQYHKNYEKLPQREAGAYLMLYSLGRYTGITAGSKWPAGKYTLRVRLAATDESPVQRRFIEIGTGKADASDFNVLSAHQVTGTLVNPQVLEVPVEINASGDRNFAIRDKRPNTREAEYAMFREAWDKTGAGPRPCIWIDYVELEGPITGGIAKPKDSETQPILFAKQAETNDREHARAVIEKFAIRAFRGQRPEPQYVDRLMALYDTKTTAGERFDVAIREPLSVILASPGFLYLNEPGQEKKPRALSPLELASRLSYFLWSAPPDGVLLDLAQKGELMKPEALSAQVNRMLSDPRSRDFVQGFVHQWLRIDRLDFFQFSPKLFRDFDESTKSAARNEVYESFGHLLANNGSLRYLLKSDYAMVNGLLANYYGLEGVEGDEFRKVSLPADSPRGGLLGMAAILAMGSNGEISSPVERGAWVLRKLLHDPPPPAPPNVPQLSRLEGKLLTTRERLLAHMEEPQCSSCHRKIDPIGFGLENFNAAGKWRTTDGYEKRGVGKKEWTIEAAGELYKGPSFRDYFELRDLIARKTDRFARGMTEALIEYSLGRPFGFTDESLADSMMKHATQKDFALREFIHVLVASPEFRRK